MRIEVNTMGTFNVGLVGLLLLGKNVELYMKVVSPVFTTSKAVENIKELQTDEFISYSIAILKKYF